MERGKVTDSRFFSPASPRVCFAFFISLRTFISTCPAADSASLLSSVLHPDSRLSLSVLLYLTYGYLTESFSFRRVSSRPTLTLTPSLLSCYPSVLS